MESTHPSGQADPMGEAASEKHLQQTIANTAHRECSSRSGKFVTKSLHSLQALVFQNHLRVSLVSICEKPRYIRCEYADGALSDFLLAKRLLQEHGYAAIRIADLPPDDPPNV